MNERHLEIFHRNNARRIPRAMLVGGLVLFGMLTIGASDAYAQGALLGNGRNGAQGVGAQIARALELSRAQQYRIRALREVMQRDLADERRQLSALRARLRRARSVDNPNETLVALLNHRINAVQSVIHQRHRRFQADVMRTLTPEQRRRLRSLRQSNIRARSTRDRAVPRGAPSTVLRPLAPAPINGVRIPSPLQRAPRLERIEAPRRIETPVIPVLPRSIAQ